MSRLTPLFACLFLAAPPVLADEDLLAWQLIEPAEVIVVDGDTLRLDGRTFDLYGIDAPEWDQPCHTLFDKKLWMCGQEAAHFLRRLTSEGIACRVVPDRAEPESICFAGPFEINAEMVIRGMAIHDRLTLLGSGEIPYPYHYKVYEEAAERLEMGIWGSRFTPPDRWRLIGGDEEQ